MASYPAEPRLPRFRSSSGGSRPTMDIYSPESQQMRHYEEYGIQDEYDEPTLRPVFSAHPQSHNPASRPLIDFIRNEWQTNPKFGQMFERDGDEKSWWELAWAWLMAPKVRRYILVYTLLFVALWAAWHHILTPYWSEQNVLANSLNVKMKSGTGWFGTNARPEFIDMVHIKTLDSSLVPHDKTRGSGAGRRLVIVGDVHGCKKELVELLDKVGFHQQNDHLILLGDMITKGPDSLGVIDLARDVSASCVRGNHEDRILLIHRDLSSSLIPLKGPRESVDHPEKDMMDEESFSRGDYDQRKLAKRLTDKQVDWLKSCPVILRIGDVKGMGEVVAVHAGLVPGVALEKQDPAGVMNMRTIDLETHVPSKDPKGGIPWTKLWNKHQSLLPSRAPHTTVLYGHDSHRGLSLSKYSKGLDTGCVRGKKLTAMIISDGGKTKTVSVKCKDRRPKHLAATVEDVLRDGKLGGKGGAGGSRDDGDDEE